jgi:hypothetical protein
MVTRTFLVGVLLGVVLTVAAYKIADTMERIENMEHYLVTHPIPQLELQSAPEPKSSFHYGAGPAPVQEAL